MFIRVFTDTCPASINLISFKLIPHYCKVCFNYALNNNIHNWNECGLVFSYLSPDVLRSCHSPTNLAWIFEIHLSPTAKKQIFHLQFSRVQWDIAIAKEKFSITYTGCSIIQSKSTSILKLRRCFSHWRWKRKLRV